AGLAIVIGMVIAFPLGIASAMRPNSPLDVFASILSQLGVAVPDFWMAILLVLLFSSTLGWLPPSGYTPIHEDFSDWLSHMILPALTAGLISASIQTRFIRSAMLEVLSQNYIKTARAKGLRESVVVTRHALRNALITIVTVVGLQITALLSAVVVIEIVFNLPGLGRLALDAVLDRDYTLLQGAVFVMALLVTFINLGIYDSVYSLALLHTALVLPTSVLVIASVFASVPYELEEAAQVFGCTPVRAFFSVVMPLTLPGIAAAGVFAFVTSWNEVFAAVLLTLTNRTLPAQILFSLDKSGDPFKFAGGFFMLVPSLIFIFFIRRYLFNMWGQISK
ncbi:MAG: ABC transporter permease subunit, partial [Phototrophicaceae bacterium]